MLKQGGSMTKEELEDRATRFAARVVKVCEALPMNRIGAAHFADQLFRSGTSVAANYAEAAEAESRKDFVHKLNITMKELSETRTWLKIISFAGYLQKDSLDMLVDGRYVESLRNLTLIYRGSENQRVIDLNKTRAAGEIVLYKSDFDIDIVI